MTERLHNKPPAISRIEARGASALAAVFGGRGGSLNGSIVGLKCATSVLPSGVHCSGAMAAYKAIINDPNKGAFQGMRPSGKITPAVGYDDSNLKLLMYFF